MVVWHHHEHCHRLSGSFHACMEVWSVHSIDWSMAVEFPGREWATSATVAPLAVVIQRL